MSANTANPTSPYRSYATPPTTPSPSNLNSLTNPSSAPAASAPAPGHRRRTPYNPSRPVPTLRREESCYGEESDMGAMILNIAGIDRVGYVQLGGVLVNEELTESQLGQVGVRSGWMVAAVGEDNGSQFTQGSDSSQLFDSQASQPLIPGIHTLNPYQLPSAPTVRESRQPSSSTSPSRPRGRHGPRSAVGSSLLSGTSVRRAAGRKSTGTVLSGMLEDGEE
ncbi:hypothetical protein BGX38DRAFT_1266189 [Terfezia claveryi]|nr:hypothetical protein BGX38DRAFT_1266189 [Terfezia claveryi]